MENIPGSPQNVTIMERAKAILFKPADEWPKIAAEPSNTSSILTKYAIPLIAIGPVCTLIGSQVFGFGMFGFSYRPSFMGSLSTAIIGFVMGVVGLFVLAFIANFLAPKFGAPEAGPALAPEQGGTDSKLNAFKLVAYSSTAAWVVGIFNLIPMLGILGILGLYSIYLFYTGAGPLMKVPQDKAGGYTAVTIVLAIILFFIAGAVTSAIGGMFGGNPFKGGGYADSSDASGTLTIPGMGQMDVGAMEKAAKRMEDAASGKSKPADSAALQALLPTSIGSFKRTALESTAMGGMGNVEATYEDGDNRFDLRITDTNALGALAGMGVAMGIEQSREDADGYERTGTVNGRMQTEKWRKTSNSGTYGVMVGERFMVEADGRVPNINVLKTAVASIDEGDLADLAE